MFRAIVGAILFIEIGIPLLILALGGILSLFEEKPSIGCIVFAIAIIIIISIFC